MNKFIRISIIFISIFIILNCVCFKTFKEGLTNKNTIILMGDSILNNANYVSAGKSVYDILKTKLNNVINVAKDGATINDLHKQLSEISLKYNNKNTYIFLSIGGNDILNIRTKLSENNILSIFHKYMDFLKTLRTTFGSTNINIMNLYLPSNPRYKEFQPSIKQWNQLIAEHSSAIGEKYKVLDLYSLLTSPTDFVYDIEPSVSGSSKIAYLIYLTA